MMPFPILAGLAGLASAIGAGTGAYKLGTAIKDRNAMKKAEKAQQQIATAAPNKIPGNSVKDRLLGTPNSVQQFQNLTPNQIAAQDLVLKQALANLGSNQFNFAPIENIAQQNFERKTIPSIMSRFGNQGGSDINNSLSSAGVDLNQQLAALRSQHALGQQGLNQNLLKLGLRPQFENAFLAGSPGLLEGLGQSFGNGQNISDLASYLKSLFANRNNAGGGGLNPYQNEYQMPEYGDFSQNKSLQDFINQGTNPANKNLYALEQLYGYNKPQAPAQAPNPNSSTPNLDVLRALYPNANL